MPFSKENRPHTLSGIIFVGLFALAALFICELRFFAELHVSPLIVGIVIGMFYGNTLKHRLPEEWRPGIVFCAKRILRVAIVLYGFHCTFQEIAEVGAAGLTVSALMVATTFLLGTWAGMRIFKLDRDMSMLTAAGSSVCGAAAVLAVEPVLDAAPHKGAVAVTTVVIFGTISMFLYPALHHWGVVELDPTAFGIYVGGTVHEVAQVVAVGSAIDEGMRATGETSTVADTAVIVKMSRVMLMAPMLIVLGLYVSRAAARGRPSNGRMKLVVPWFALGFVAVSGFHSTVPLPADVVDWIREADKFLLTMAMTALGMETDFKSFKAIALKPFYLAFVMFAWLIVGGYFITSWAVRVM